MRKLGPLGCRFQVPRRCRCFRRRSVDEPGDLAGAHLALRVANEAVAAAAAAAKVEKMAQKCVRAASELENLRRKLRARGGLRWDDPRTLQGFWSQYPEPRND